MMQREGSLKQPFLHQIRGGLMSKVDEIGGHFYIYSRYSVAQ